MIINAKNNKQVGLSKVDDYGQVPFKDPKTGKWYSILTHRLVWVWFKGLITDASLEVNHEDGNKRNTILLKIGKSTKNISEWSKESGVPAKIIRQRYFRGWDSRNAVFKPLREQN